MHDRLVESGRVRGPYATLEEAETAARQHEAKIAESLRKLREKKQDGKKRSA